MQAQWGCLICLELGQNPWEELGQNARSQSKCVQHAAGLILWESSRLAEQPSTGSCLRAPPSMVLQQPVAELFSSLDPQQFQGRKIEENTLYWILPAQWYWEESERQNLVMK